MSAADARADAMNGRMMSSGAFAQLRALVPVAIGNATRARWASASIVACVMLSVLVLCAFLAMSRGFHEVGESAGSERMVVMLGRQATMELESDIGPEQPMLLNAAQVLESLSADARVSPEVVVSVSRRAKGQSVKVSSTLRGMSAEGLRLRERQGFELVEGRLFRQGMYEIVVGSKLSEQVDGLEVGNRIVLSGKTWSIVGIYRMDNRIFETEYYADVGSVQEAFDRQNQFQSMYGWLRPDATLDGLKAYVAEDPRFQVDVLTQRDLLRAQVEDTSNLILHLGWPLVFLLSIGTFAGVLNIMLMAIEGRRRNLSVLLMLGFTPGAIRMTVVLETVMLALLGAALGTLLMYLAADGREHSMVGRSFNTIDYAMQIDAGVLLQALGLALVLGLLGGALASLSISGGNKTKGSRTT